jgi:nicotinamidase/pyrazinamidase
MERMARTALIIVDAQNDYLPGGSLGFPGSDEIIKPLVEFANLAADVVIASRNLYPPDHESFNLKRKPGDPIFTPSMEGSWPVNCVKGTKGASVVPEIAHIAEYVVTKGMKRDQWGFSAFEAGTLRPLKSLEDILHDEKVTHVAVGGYWLEWCVAQTAFDANALGYDTAVEMDLSMSLGGPFRASDQAAKLEKAGVTLA